jgi:division protein CdvB (Snf7/Vps24/ESCRT-III family)
MLWEEVRKRFPNEWVVFEATDAFSQDGFRYMNEVKVIDRYNDSIEAMRRYKELHRNEPLKEIYFLHTSRPDLKIEEKWIGFKRWG